MNKKNDIPLKCEHNIKSPLWKPFLIKLTLLLCILFFSSISIPFSSLLFDNLNNKAFAEEVQTTQITEEKKSTIKETTIQEELQKTNISEAKNYNYPINFGWRQYFQAIAIMLFLLLVLWYILKIVRRYGEGKFLPQQKLLPKDSMYLEGQLSLGPNKCVAIVHVLDKRLVLAVTEKDIRLLTEIKEDKEENNDDFTKKPSFEEHIQHANAQLDHKK